MSWKFTIINRFNEETVIEEPVGWDKNVAEIKRDTEWHGIFFSTQGEAFEFTGKAMQLLKKEYDEFGAEGYMLLVMSEDCGNGIEEFARGRFNFSKYEFYCGDYCFVKVPVENVSEIIDLRNRINQKVDLDQLKAFDEVTDLVPYNKLPFDILFPSKGIKVQNKAEVEQAGESTLDTFFGTQNVAWFQIVPQFDKVVFSEFGQFITVDKPELTVIKWGPYSNNLETDFEIVVNGTFFTPPDTRKVLFDWARATPILHNDGNKNGFNDIKSFPLNIDYSFQFETKRGHIYSLYKIVVIRRKNGTFDYLAKDRIFSGTQGSYFGYNQSSIWDYNTVHTVSFTANFPEVILSEGESLYIAVCGLGWATTVAPEGWKLTTQTGLVNMETLSYGQPTVSRVFAINETLSRITESITNDNVRAYSEYFGRKDSQPYNVPNDGEGSLAVLTDGIRIRRQENNIEGKTRVFSQSLKDVFEGMNPIHNIGMGVEPDPLRPGHNRLRVEKWDHFYNDAVAMSCIGVGEISRKTNEKEIYSTFQFGYAKWEAEEYNGLDEFLTKRNYRTTLSRVKNDLVNLSTFIASGYAIEITRRKGNENTKDWRYDKDVFIICVKRGDKSDFLVNFSAPNTVNVAIFNSEDYVLNFFQAGANITIDSPLNSGNHTVLSAVKIGNSLSVTLSGTVVNEFTTAGFTTDAGLAVEQGNVLNPVNIVDPDTIYNYRISPVRNAMRWMNKVLASYEKFDEGAKIIFTDGDGNYFASGQMEDNSGKLENGILSEDATLTPGKFIDSNRAKPFLETERISFEYPMSSREFKTIEANPYGLVYFENDCEEGLGWIDTIKYTPDEGLAEFVLIPAIEATPTGCIPVAIRGDMTLPKSFIGVPYSHVVQLYGTAPFEIIDIIKPNWMTIAVSGTSIYLKGIPTNAGTFEVAWIAKNCGEGAAAYSSSIDVEAFICNAVGIAGTPELPDGYVNAIYNYSIYLTGDTPYLLSIVQKPDWMTISLSGNAVTFAGTPLEDATGEVVSITIGNCSDDEVSFSGEIDITSVCLQALIPDEELPNALIGFAYNYQMQIGGTAPFELTNVVKPAWMTIALEGSELIFSGSPDVAGEDVEISFTVSNCSETDEVFSDTINVIATGGGGAWGSITGTLSDQEDLQNELDVLQAQINAITAVGNKLFNYYNFT